MRLAHFRGVDAGARFNKTRHMTTYPKLGAVMTLGQYLRKLRIEKGLMQKQVAEELGVTGSYLSNLEREYRSYLGEDMLKRFSRALCLTDSEITRIQELREVAHGQISIPRHTSEDEAALIRVIAECAGRVPASQIRAICTLLEPWRQMPIIEERRIA